MAPESATDNAGGPGAVDLSDRLYAVMSELAVVADAVAGASLARLSQNGLHVILDRQIAEIAAVKAAIHPEADE